MLGDDFQFHVYYHATMNEQKFVANGQSALGSAMAQPHQPRDILMLDDDLLRKIGI
jgi:hypothetical protein